MQTVTVTASEAGRKLDRYLMKRMPKAAKGFIYKQLRGNGFRINGKRIRDPEYIVQAEDVLAIYMTDEQLREVGFENCNEDVIADADACISPKVPVVYEDENLVIFNKPAGLLSQKNTETSVSLNEIGAEYLYRKGLPRTAGFRPGVCNRLDQNTSGAVIMSKNLEAAQAVSAMIRDRMIDKYYYALVSGCAQWSGIRECVHYFYKDQKNNRLHLYEKPTAGAQQEVKCRVSVVDVNPKANISLLKVQLITGKSHQIRSQLAQIGYPILGDPKYRRVKEYQEDQNKFGIQHQMLCAVELHFREVLPVLSYLKGQRMTASLPADMQTIATHYFTLR